MINNFLLRSGDAPLHLIFTHTTASLSEDTQILTSYLSRYSLRISGIAIRWCPDETDDLAEFIATHITPLDLPMLQFFRADNLSSRLLSNITHEIAPNLRTITLNQVKPTISHPIYNNLHALYINHEDVGLSDLFSIIINIASLRMLEMTPGVQRIEENLRVPQSFSHPYLRNLGLGAIPQQEADIFFSRISLPSLTHLCITLQYSHERVLLQLPTSLRPLLRDSSSLKLRNRFVEGRPIASLIFSGISRVTELLFGTLYDHPLDCLDWNKVASEIVLPTQMDHLTTLNVNVDITFPETLAWNSFLRRHGSFVRQLVWAGEGLSHFLNAMHSDRTLLPLLKNMDVRWCDAVPRVLLESLRPTPESHMLSVLMLPNRFEWRATQAELRGLSTQLVIKNNVPRRCSMSYVFRVVD